MEFLRRPWRAAGCLAGWLDSNIYKCTPRKEVTYRPWLAERDIRTRLVTTFLEPPSAIKATFCAVRAEWSK